MTVVLCDCGAGTPHKVYCAVRRAERERRVAEAAPRRPARRETLRERNEREAAAYWAKRRGRAG